MSSNNTKAEKNELDTIDDSMSQNVEGGNHESVEEAVLKYVREGFQQNELNKISSDSANDANNNNEADEHSGKQGSMAASNDDMSWYLKHDEDIPQYERGVNATAADDQNSNSESVAMAAVAAAYASTTSDDKKKSKHKRSHDDKDSKKKKKRKHKKSSKEGDFKTSDSTIAVDPELATLDDGENHSAQAQLVRKAIIDTASITQNPDFQQYLNTDISSKDDNNSNNDSNDKKSTTTEHKDSKDDDKTNHTGSVSEEHSVAVEDPSQSGKGYNSLAKDYTNVLPKTMSIVDVTLKTDDDTHLLQRAASKASALVTETTQNHGKAFDPVEENALDQFIEQYSKIKGFDREQTCERIWTNGRRKDDFWINICKVLPYRTRSSIYKHVRRRYHIFTQRGKWTPEEDAELSRLCMEKEGQWSEVGRALGRMPEDCRDRWRNYIKCGNNRTANKWSTAEEEQLKNIIGKMIFLATHKDGEEYVSNDEDSVDEDGLEIIRSLPSIPKGQEFGRTPEFKDVINWTVVSEQMHGTRSRIQCRYKWNKLVRKQAVQRIQTISEATKKWTLEKLRDLGFTEDSQVDWDELAALCPEQGWSGLELKLSYEKMRSLIKGYRSQNINEISKKILDIIDGTTESKKK